MSVCDDFTEDATLIFSTGAGKAVAVTGPGVPVDFFVDGSNDTFHDLKAIVTSVGLQGQGGFQFMHTLREFVYVYVFTERVGEMVISGIAFPASCEPMGPQDNDSDLNCFHGNSGLERVLTWYDCNRITSRASPITISFGTVVYDAFLVGVKADILNADTGIAQFSFRFNYLPNTAEENDFCLPTDEDCLEAPCTE